MKEFAPKEISSSEAAWCAEKKTNKKLYNLSPWYFGRKIHQVYAGPLKREANAS